MTDSAKEIFLKSTEYVQRDTSVDKLTTKEFIEREEALSTIELRRKAVVFLFWAYGGLLAVTVVIILLQGFHLFGFNLEMAFLHWLGGVTLTEVASLAVLVYKFLFTRFSNHSRDSRADHDGSSSSASL